MTGTGIAELLENLRGDDYIAVLRSIAALAREQGAYVPCGTGDCHESATYIGMQKCGAPGGPVCEVHYQRHQEWMASAAQLGTPYCRHCGQDVDSSHCYVVPLQDRSAEGHHAQDRSAEGGDR